MAKVMNVHVVVRLLGHSMAMSAKVSVSGGSFPSPSEKLWLQGFNFPLILVCEHAYSITALVSNELQAWRIHGAKVGLKHGMYEGQ